MRLWTIGHSTRTQEELVGVLRAHGVEALVDVRAFPRSRRHPDTNRESLEASLPGAGILYRWMGDTLGGFRKSKRADTPHVALRNDSFRAYADHMESASFARGIEALLEIAREKRTAYMCSELLWWRCHRSLISDHLTALHGAEVVHIENAQKTSVHRVLAAARVADGKLIYDVLDQPRLF